MSALIPSPAQLQAIQAPLGPVLVLAGPGAGKTFCLIERIRHLIEKRGIAAERICAFTFTNKAAEEISHRLGDLGARAGLVRRGTIHAFCADLLRELGAQVGLRRGFGIADEDYQRQVLSRLGTPYRWQKELLTRFTQHRFQDKALGDDDAKKFRKYERYLEERHIVDFDTLVLRASALLEHPQVLQVVQSRFDYVLVDEFQDLNPVQFHILHRLAASHCNLFGVGDDEQSIYSWAGADPRVFATFTNTFQLTHTVMLSDNRRCPQQVMTLARRLIDYNTPIFAELRTIVAEKQSAFAVETKRFSDDGAEATWLLADVRRDHEAHALRWGDVAVLYRTNKMGSGLEAEFLKSGVPCRMAQGRALADDPVVAYLIAALQVIVQPGDPAREAEFMRGVLPRTLYGEALTRAEARDNAVLAQLDQIARERPKGSEDAKKIKRGQYELQNLSTLASKHHALDALIQDLLSHRVGEYRSVLEERHDELSDPATNPEVVALADQLSAALAAHRPVAFAPMGGVEIALRGMLAGARHRALLLERAHPLGPLVISPEMTPSLGPTLGMFKALQYIATREFTDIFQDFTAFDIEATGRDVTRDRILEVAAVRVRNGIAVAEFSQLVNPGRPIPPEASAVHHITDEMVAEQPTFREVWPRLQAFLGRDVIVAHNGHGYDFPLLRRHVEALGGVLELTPYDSLPLARELHAGSRSLPELAHVFGVDRGASHRALDDTRTLALVFLKLNELKLTRARKTALSNLLAQVGIGLALSDSRNDEATRLFDTARLFSFSQHSDCLEAYERERIRANDPSIPTVDALIDKLGGSVLMARVRADKDADKRYPETMARLRRLLEDVAPDMPLTEQIHGFLQTVVLSKWDGTETDRDRVNLLTLHATKGLEFPRVYVVGVSDDDLLTGQPDKRSKDEVEEARRLLYVGMTRTQERLVLTYADQRGGNACTELRFLAEMGVLSSSAASRVRDIL
ncbi:MAG: UvrD-helicase domain-containing protein [Gemmatimonadaceae bacterium]